MTALGTSFADVAVVTELTSIVIIGKMVNLPLCALRHCFCFRVGQTRAVFALLDVWVVRGSGREPELVKVPGLAEVSRLGVEVALVDRRGKMVWDMLAGVVFFAFDAVEVELAGETREVVEVVVDVQEEGWHVTGVGDIGRRSLPRRARSRLLDWSNRLCIFGLLTVKSRCIGVKCFRTSRRSICSASPSE